MFSRAILLSSPHSWRCGALAALVACTAALPSQGATFVVDRFDDANGSCDPGDCSVREALLAAETSPGRDTLLLPAGRHLLSIAPVPPGGLDPTFGSLDVLSHPVDIRGAEDGETIIDGQGIDRVLVFLDSVSTVRNVTVTGGLTEGPGGGLASELSQLEVENVRIVENSAAFSGAGLAVLLGTVTLDHVTISGNQSRHSGGGVYLFGISQTRVGRLEVRNSTISGNHADLASGAIEIGSAGQLLLEYSTIAENTNRPGDTTIGPFLSHPPADAVYTLVEGTCSAGPDTSCIYLSSKAEEVPVPDLGLEPLALNGGLTPTHALLPASPAIDVVPADAACPDDDQRGAPRPEDGDHDGEARCDAGSFELSGPPVVEIPTLGELGELVLIVLLAGAAVVALRR